MLSLYWPVLYWFMRFRFCDLISISGHLFLSYQVPVCATPHLKGQFTQKCHFCWCFFHLHMGSKPVCYYYFWWKTKVEVQLRPYKFQAPKRSKTPKSTLKIIHITSIYQILWSFMVSYSFMVLIWSLMSIVTMNC